MATPSIRTPSRTIIGLLTATSTAPPSGDVVATSLPLPRCGPSSTLGSDCWPSAKPEQSQPLWRISSPGLACPQGYVTACIATSVATDAGGQPATSLLPVARPSGPQLFQFNLTPNESAKTVVGCCPTGFECGYAQGYQICRRRVDARPATASSAPGRAPEGDGKEPLAPPQQLQFRPRDLQPTTTLATRTASAGASPSAASAAASGSLANAPPTTALAAPSETPTTMTNWWRDKPATGPSTPPAVIAAAACIPVVLIVALMVFAVWRSRRGPQSREPAALGFGSDKRKTPSYVLSSGTGSASLREWPSEPPSERPPELPTDQAPRAARSKQAQKRGPAMSGRTEGGSWLDLTSDSTEPQEWYRFKDSAAR